VFDEGLKTLLDRADALGMSLRSHVERGTVSLQPVDPAEMSPGQFCALVREAVEQRDVKMIVIDSLNGYLHAMPEEQSLNIQLHELVTYLRQRGIVTVMVVAQSGLLGTSMTSPIDVSYLADGVVLFRYFEADGRVRKAISVVKKRSGFHEDTIREFSLGPTGVHVGPPLDNFQGVLTGNPRLKRLGEDPDEG
jgi:circadian clock protein KaiC